MLNKQNITLLLSVAMFLFFIYTFCQELLKLKIRRIISNFWESLKIIRDKKTIVPKTRIFLYFISPVLIALIMKFELNISISEEYLSTISTILALAIGFFMNALFVVADKIEKIENTTKKSDLIEWYDSLIYEILISFLCFIIIIVLFFFKCKFLELLSFIFCIHAALVFLFLFRTLVILLTLDI